MRESDFIYPTPTIQPITDLHYRLYAQFNDEFLTYDALRWKGEKKSEVRFYFD